MSAYCLECSKLKQDCCWESHSKFTTLGDACRIAEFLGTGIGSSVIYAGLNYKDLEEDIYINKRYSYYYDLTLKDGKLLQLKYKSDGSCFFQEADGRCGIYPARPLICRTYPFWYSEEGAVIMDGCSSDCRVVCALTGNNDPEDITKLADRDGSLVARSLDNLGIARDSICQVLDQMMEEIEDYRINIDEFIKKNMITVL